MLNNKKVISLAFSVLIFLFIVGAYTMNKNSNVTAESSDDTYISKDFKKFHSDYEKLTRAQQDTYWKEIEGKRVLWALEVDNVKQERVILTSGGMLAVPEVEATVSKARNDWALSLKKGEKITIDAKLTRQYYPQLWQVAIE
ncbi:hypothetical protein [Paenibacillus alginolyticus]|uniref:Uncharacterized protein n=1 Tax=Paenibacillus alginolyticus TaxID=59839 RepID=A0ABT4GLI4_9BACL|nr:hypothetical protein [Paenibacillus alginolyticus]MCY9697064.1 hypothetical protein [Paenibacillus alginolyticus]MEC0147458.1 hypothetical protein [Paenibacillus alginolyticus]